MTTLPELHHWTYARDLERLEAYQLIAGVDPTKEELTDLEASKVVVFEREISYAVERAMNLAWDFNRQLESARLDADKSKYESLRLIADIWSDSEDPSAYLPTIEIRDSVRKVQADVDNVPILVVIDPWYTATVTGPMLNTWIDANRIESGFQFADNQKIFVTRQHENYDAMEDEADKEKDAKAAAARAAAAQVPPQARPLGTRERNVLLCLVAALCREAKIDYLRHAKAAGNIKDLATRMGVSVGESTIEQHLKRIPEALESRTS